MNSIHVKYTRSFRIHVCVPPHLALPVPELLHRPLNPSSVKYITEYRVRMVQVLETEKDFLLPTHPSFLLNLICT